MRKLSCASIALVLLAVAGKSFALTFSMGAGIAPTYSSSELTASASGGATDRVSSSVSLASKLFFDITYAEIDIGYMIDHGSTPGVAATITAPSFNGEATYFTIAGFAKYPIDLGGVLIFPLLGAQLNLNLTLTDASGNDLKAGFTPAQQADLNKLWLMGGVGADVILGRFFLAPGGPCRVQAAERGGQQLPLSPAEPRAFLRIPDLPVRECPAPCRREALRALPAQARHVRNGLDGAGSSARVPCGKIDVHDVRELGHELLGGHHAVGHASDDPALPPILGS